MARNVNDMWLRDVTYLSYYLFDVVVCKIAIVKAINYHFSVEDLKRKNVKLTKE